MVTNLKLNLTNPKIVEIRRFLLFLNFKIFLLIIRQSFFFIFKYFKVYKKLKMPNFNDFRVCQFSEHKFKDGHEIYNSKICCQISDHMVIKVVRSQKGPSLMII